MKFLIWLLTNIAAVILGFALPAAAYYPFEGGALAGTVIGAGILLGFVMAICGASSIENGDYASNFGWVMMYIFIAGIVAIGVLSFIFEKKPFITIFFLLAPLAYIFGKGGCYYLVRRNSENEGRNVLMVIVYVIAMALAALGLGYLVNKFPNVMIFVNPIAGGVLLIVGIILVAKQKEAIEYNEYDY